MSSDRIIPGPAGRIQRALARRGQPVVDLGTSQMPNWQTTQEYLAEELNRPDDERDSAEDPFAKSSWLQAMNFVKSEQFMVMTEIDMDVPITPLNLIGRNGPKKPDKIVAMIETVELCMDRESFKVTVRDPTARGVRATIHRTAVWEKETRDMVKVGAVLVLQKVSVWCPRYKEPALNITGMNLVRIYVEGGTRWYNQTWNDTPSASGE